MTSKELQTLLEQLGRFMARNEHVVTNALNNQADRMTEAAKTTREAFEAGQADAGVKAQQDASFVTNNGLRQSVALFEEDAAKARKVAEGLSELLDMIAEADD